MCDNRMYVTPQPLSTLRVVIHQYSSKVYPVVTGQVGRKQMQGLFSRIETKRSIPKVAVVGRSYMMTLNSTKHLIRSQCLPVS